MVEIFEGTAKERILFFQKIPDGFRFLPSQLIIFDGVHFIISFLKIPGIMLSFLMTVKFLAIFHAKVMFPGKWPKKSIEQFILYYLLKHYKK